jgi:hypothetical protein
MNLDGPLDNVPIVRCGQSHGAEIVGYPELYPPKSTWPGENAVYAASLAACQALPGIRTLPTEFTFSTVWPAKDWWPNPDRPICVGCLVYRADDRLFTGPPR